MTDPCSARSFEDLKVSGELGRSQAMYFYVFWRAGIEKGDEGTMTHRQADDAVLRAFNRKMPARNTRILELEQMGLVERRGTETDQETGKTVNRYIWTGRLTPYEHRMEWQTCRHCQGKGGRLERVYTSAPITIPRDLFGDQKNEQANAR